MKMKLNKTGTRQATGSGVSLYFNETVTTRKEKLERLVQYGKSASAGRGSIVGKLLRFTKGEWLAGQDDEEIAVGTKVILNPDSLMAGWTRWEANKPAEQDMGPVIEGFQPKLRSALGWDDKTDWEEDTSGQKRDPWQFGNQVLMKGTGKNGDIYTFVTTSKGGIGVLGKLIEDAANKSMERDNDDFPIITLGKDFYMHPTYKKVFIPLFEIVGWSAASSFKVAPAEEPKKGAKQLTY